MDDILGILSIVLIIAGAMSKKGKKSIVKEIGKTLEKAGEQHPLLQTETPSNSPVQKTMRQQNDSQEINSQEGFLQTPKEGLENYKTYEPTLKWASDFDHDAPGDSPVTNKEIADLEQSPFAFSDNPMVQGLIMSEIFARPLPQRRRLK